jgi:hypothetical protein
MSTIVHYHLLTYDVNKNESMEQDDEIENEEYFSLSSSTPTMSNINGLIDESNR